ncbi:MAG: metalloregulator ArsR/SmtB family transcription factor [Gammaproteobacteria bacterium]|nr:MAG: metalloregulator ArsR/SmtB family transcription factor [Gammaproteobacteria bacterium]
MVNYQMPDLDGVFHALADPTRRAIIGALARGPKTVGEISRPFDISLPAVSKHLKVLERARLVSRQVRGREHHCRLNAETLAPARDWLSFYSGFWGERLDALDALLHEQDQDGDES